MPKVLDPTVEAEYLALVRDFPLLSIRDDGHLEEALAVVERLLGVEERSTAEDAYLDALVDLVEIYEDAHVDIPPVSGVAVLRHLMEENGLTQADLAPMFGTRSIVSEVLSGKRHLALSHIQKLAEHFGLPADVFMSTRASDGRSGAVTLFP